MTELPCRLDSRHGRPGGPRYFADMAPYCTFLLLPFLDRLSVPTPRRPALIALFAVLALESEPVDPRL